MSKIFGVSTDYLLKEEQEEPEYIQTQEVSEVRRVSMEEAADFLAVKAKAAGRIALGTCLCILGVILLILMGASTELEPAPLSENAAGGIGMLLLLLFVAGGVALFLSCGAQTRRYLYLEEDVFETEYGVTGMVRQRQEAFKPFYDRYNILGTVLCILSLLPLFMGIIFTEEDVPIILMLCLMLAIAAIGISFFIRAGVPWASFGKLLQEGEYSKAAKKRSRISSAVSTIYWLVVVAGYLAYSFITENWENSWVLWPVAGVLYSALAVAMGAFSKKDS